MGEKQWSTRTRGRGVVENIKAKGGGGIEKEEKGEEGEKCILTSRVDHKSCSGAHGFLFPPCISQCADAVKLDGE